MDKQMEIEKRVESFVAFNAASPVYKGAWNKDSTRLKFWFVGGRTFSLSEQEMHYMREKYPSFPKWIGVAA